MQLTFKQIEKAQRAMSLISKLDKEIVYLEKCAGILANHGYDGKLTMKFAPPGAVKGERQPTESFGWDLGGLPKGLYMRAPGGGVFKMITMDSDLPDAEGDVLLSSGMVTDKRPPFELAADIEEETALRIFELLLKDKNNKRKSALAFLASLDIVPTKNK